MSDKYTHPNGYAVTDTPHPGGLYVTGVDEATTWLIKDEVEALRDFFLDELGLWRDPETGLLVLTGTWANLGDGGVASVYDGDVVRRGFPNAAITPSDHAVARWCASLAPQPREPKPGEVWRITLEDGTERTALVDTDEFNWVSDLIAIADIPADRRRLLVEADGTVVADDE